MKRIITLFLLLCGAMSCLSEQAGGPVSNPVRANTHFSVVIDDNRDIVPTKTVLTDGSIETKISSISLAIYASDGSLVGKKYVTSGFDDIQYMLDVDETFRVYALANMGDMCDSFPSAISGDASLKDITYRIPSYTSGDDCINARGIPMVGTLVYSATGKNAGQEGQIILTRLLSKLQVHLTCNWPGTLRTVKIYNLNRTLKPFGESVAVSGKDILGEQEVNILDADAKEGDFLFYIPENRQGKISRIRSSKDKSQDNSAVTNPELKSYMEAVVTGVSGNGVNGTMTYRSYLGGNSSSDFNIGRNCRYVWNVQYLPGNMQNNDWKHENELSWKEYSYTLSVPPYLYYGQRENSTLSIYSDSYEQGVFVARKKDNSGIPSITYSVTPGDGSVLSHTTVSDGNLYFTGAGPGTAKITATCYDPFNTDGVVCSGSVYVLNYKREIFLRTPYGDYYDGEIIPVPYGTTWNDIMIGMKKTYTDNRVEKICPIVIGSDNLNSVSVSYPAVGPEHDVLSYRVSSGNTGQAVSFSHTFSEGRYRPRLLNEFIIACYYKDYASTQNSSYAFVKVDITDVSSEYITVNSDKDEACWTDGSVALTASSTAVVNGVGGAQTSITASNDYEWTTRASAGMNPQLTLSGGTRLLSVSKAGTVTVTVTKKSDRSVTASRTITFTDQYSYRLNVTPKTVNVQVNDVLRTTDLFTAYRDIYVNGTLSRSEPFNGSLAWSVKSGSSSYLTANHVSGSDYKITAKKQGTASLIVNTTSSDVDWAYRENEITVNIGQADDYSVTLSPASVSVDVNASAPVLEFVVKNNGNPVTGLSASDLAWHTRNSAVATVSGGVITGKTAGSTKVYATYAGVSSNEVNVTVAPVQVVSSRYKVVTTVSPASIKVGQTSTASAVRYKKTLVNGVETTGWEADGNVTSSGFTDEGHSGKISISGSTITALATGSATIKSLCSADEYENATLSISESDYAVSITPAVGADLILGKKVSQAYTAVATRDGKPASGGLFEWSLTPAGKASLNTTSGPSVTATASAAGSTTLKVNYKVDGIIRASASADFTVFDNSLGLTLDKTSVPVNGNAAATVTFRSNDGASVKEQNVTGQATVRAYTSESGSTLSSKVLVGTDGTITGKDAGDCWLEATCAVDGYNYTSPRVKVTVTDNPLQLDWSSDGAAVYVAQRGLLVAGGLDDSSASVTYTVTSGADKVRLSQNGKNVYVGLLAPGSYTVRATSSNGQEGTFSGIVSAPMLSANATTFYANPDGSVAHTGTDGLTGNTLAVSYRAGSATFATTTDPIAVGNRLYKSLFEELLAPSYAVSSGSGLAAGKDGIWVARLSSPAYPQADGTDIGTVTISPKAASTGIADVRIKVLSVHPFRDITTYQTHWDEFADKEMISKYVDCMAVSSNARVPSGVVRASSGSIGWDVYVAGTADQTMKDRFTYDGNVVRFQYDEGDALPHIGGVCEFRLAVTNRHSAERMTCPVVDFPVKVFGAVGGVPVINGSSTFRVKSAYLGPEIARPTYCQFSTSFRNGQTVDVYVGSSTAGQRRTGRVSVDGTYKDLGEVLYSITTVNGQPVININHVYKSIHPSIVINGTVPKEHSLYYEILNLETVQTKVIHSSFLPGWIIPD